jgi:hypothetical protein
MEKEFPELFLEGEAVGIVDFYDYDLLGYTVNIGPFFLMSIS